MSEVEYIGPSEKSLEALARIMEAAEALGTEQATRAATALLEAYAFPPRIVHRDE